VDNEELRHITANVLRREADLLARILHDNPDLARLVAAWPDLPLPIRSAMLTLLGAAGQ
jgi:hypothetical protein